MFSILIFSLLVNAKQCDPIFGLKKPNGAWRESINTPCLGCYPIELDEDCQWSRDSVVLDLSKGKYVVNLKKVEANEEIDKKLDAIESELKSIKDSQKTK